MQNEGSQVEGTLSPLAYCLILPSLHVFPFKKLIRPKKKRLLGGKLDAFNHRKSYLHILSKHNLYVFYKLAQY